MAFCRNKQPGVPGQGACCNKRSRATAASGRTGGVDLTQQIGLEVGQTAGAAGRQRRQGNRTGRRWRWRIGGDTDWRAAQGAARSRRGAAISLATTAAAGAQHARGEGKCERRQASWTAGTWGRCRLKQERHDREFKAWPKEQGKQLCWPVANRKCLGESPDWPHPAFTTGQPPASTPKRPVRWRSL